MSLKVSLSAASALVLATLLASCARPVPPATTLPQPPATRPHRAASSADVAAPRKDNAGHPDEAWLRQHQIYVARAQKGNIGLYFVGDAITQRWTTTGKTAWQQFSAWNPANFGIGGDKTQHILWRLQNGELPPKTPKVFVLMAGANNRGSDTPAQTAAGILAIADLLHQKAPNACVLILGILPRNGPHDPARQFAETVNHILAQTREGRYRLFRDINNNFLNFDGALRQSLFEENGIYLTPAGYQAEADALEPILKFLFDRQL